MSVLLFFFFAPSTHHLVARSLKNQVGYSDVIHRHSISHFSVDLSGEFRAMWRSRLPEDLRPDLRTRR